jgi:hypothetical protein
MSVICDEIRANPRACDELAMLGVSPAAIRHLRSLTAPDDIDLAAKALTRLELCPQVLAEQPSFAELVGAYVRRGASTDMLTELLGLSIREIAVQRAAVGVSVPTGRPPGLDESSIDRVRAVWMQLDHLPRAIRLLSLAERLPMWPFASLYAAVK